MALVNNNQAWCNAIAAATTILMIRYGGWIIVPPYCFGTECNLLLLCVHSLHNNINVCVCDIFTKNMQHKQEEILWQAQKQKTKQSRGTITPVNVWWQHGLRGRSPTLTSFVSSHKKIQQQSAAYKLGVFYYKIWFNFPERLKYWHQSFLVDCCAGAHSIFWFPVLCIFEIPS